MFAICLIKICRHPFKTEDAGINLSKVSKKCGSRISWVQVCSGDLPQAACVRNFPVPGVFCAP